MANNSYKANKFRNDLPKALVESTADTTTPSLDDNYDTALEEIKAVVTALNKELKKISTEVAKLQKDKKSGSEIVSYCKKTAKKVDQVQTEIENTLKEFTNVIDKVEKDEIKRIMAWYREQMAATTKADQA